MEPHPPSTSPRSSQSETIPFPQHDHEPISGHVLGLLDLLGCAECKGPLTEMKDALVCQRCGHRYRQHDGVMDFAPLVEQSGAAQRLMEAPALAPLYEQVVRPLMTHAVSHIDYTAEARWLDRWFSDLGGPVIDLGCGTGRYTRLLAARLQAPSILGIDLSMAMLREAQRQAEAQLLPLAHVRGDAHALPIQSDALAGVSCFMALHLFPDTARALDEVVRTLKPGGRFAGITIGAAGTPLMKRVEQQLSHHAAMHLFDEALLDALFDRAGLHPIEIRHDGMALLFAARKPGPSLESGLSQGPTPAHS